MEKSLKIEYLATLREESKKSCTLFYDRYASQTNEETSNANQIKAEMM